MTKKKASRRHGGSVSVAYRGRQISTAAWLKMKNNGGRRVYGMVWRHLNQNGVGVNEEKENALMNNENIILSLSIPGVKSKRREHGGGGKRKGRKKAQSNENSPSISGNSPHKEKGQAEEYAGWENLW